MMVTNNLKLDSYKKITEAGLERNIGKRAAMFLEDEKSLNRDNRVYSVGVIDYNSNGDLCLRADGEGHNELIEIINGDFIRLSRKGNGGNQVRDYFFVE